MQKIIIIGGMAAGCQAATRLNRLSPDYQITLIERKEFISFGNCGLPLYDSGEKYKMYDLAKTSHGEVRDEVTFVILNILLVVSYFVVK